MRLVGYIFLLGSLCLLFSVACANNAAESGVGRACTRFEDCIAPSRCMAGFCRVPETLPDADLGIDADASDLEVDVPGDIVDGAGDVDLTDSSDLMDTSDLAVDVLEDVNFDTEGGQ